MNGSCPAECEESTIVSGRGAEYTFRCEMIHRDRQSGSPTETSNIAIVVTSKAPQLIKGFRTSRRKFNKFCTSIGVERATRTAVDRGFHPS
jgi:hypothetical protein